MKQSTKDQIEGTAHEIKGSLNEKIGELFNDPKRKLEGEAEQLLGHAQREASELKKKLEA
jgi:uncharacterized protein YjbJ (UPF0337 family)